jgi:hypothetical protein
MQTYNQFRPTQFDSCGQGLQNQQNWLVAPVSVTRDSMALERANFDATLRELGGESETVQVHRFGHWGPGWFEIILIDPDDRERVMVAEEIENALADYPIVDESLYSEYEDADCAETWERCYSADERLEYFRRHSFTAQSLSDLLQAIRGGSWHHAANLLHCPSDLLT